MNNPSLTTSQRWAVVIMDVLLLAELCFCMYLAGRNMETMVPMFLKTYVPTALVTLVGARIIIKRLGPPREDAETNPEGA